jgi:hypothetical protein
MTDSMTEPDGPWVGDIVHDPAANGRAILTDVRSNGTYLLRAPHGCKQWLALQPSQLQVVTKRADRTDW